MITTWPCLTEAAHLLRSVGGWTYVLDLWRLREVGALRIHHPREMELNRIRILMEMDMGILLFHNHPVHSHQVM